MPYPYYNSYPQGYSPYQPYQQQSAILWASQAEAEQYPVAPNCAVALWDRNQPSIYVKTADATGRTSMRIIDYTDRSAAQEKPTDNPELATKADVAALLEAVKGLEAIVRGENNA